MEIINYQIAIPSYKRADILQKGTLSMLNKFGVDKKRITIFVANEDELKEYTNVLGNEYKIVVAVPNLWKARKWYNENYYKKNTPILNIDDDVYELKTLKGDKLESANFDLDMFVSLAFKICEKNKTKIWGICPTENAFYMSNDITIGLRYICGIFHGTYAGENYLVRNDRSQESSGEDMETTLQAFKEYGCVIRFEFICPKTKYFANGGIDAELKSKGITDRQVDHTKNLESIAKRFPEYCKLYKKAGDITNIRFKPITLGKLPRPKLKGEKNG